MADEVVAGRRSASAHECRAPTRCSTSPFREASDRGFDAADTAASPRSTLRAPSVVLVEACRHHEGRRRQASALPSRHRRHHRRHRLSRPTARLEHCTSAASPSACRRPLATFAVYTVGAGVFAMAAERRERRRRRVRTGWPPLSAGEGRVGRSQVVEKSGVEPDQGRRRRGRRPRLRRGVSAGPGPRPVPTSWAPALACSRPLTEGVNWLPTRDATSAFPASC